MFDPQLIVLAFLLLPLTGLFTLAVRRVNELGKAPSFDRANFSTAMLGRKQLVSVIVPAKNEEEVVGKCLDSLAKQTYPFLEILVVIDDGSSDGTEKVAQSFGKNDPRFKVIEAGPKPSGWAGKTWPCWRGFEESSGSILFFTDADTFLEPDCIEYSVAALVGKGYDILSLAPLVKLQGLWAGVIIPYLTLSINIFYPMTKVNSPSEKVAYVFGSFFVITRAGYEKIGGHKSVREQLVEDRAIGELGKASGLKLRLERGPDMSHTVWESEFFSIWQGLQRIFSSPLRRRPWLGFPASVAGLAQTVLPTITLTLSLIQIVIGQGTLVTYGIFYASLACFGLLVLLLGIELRVISRANLAYSFWGFLGGAIYFSAMALTSFKLLRGKGLEWRGSKYLQGDEKIKPVEHGTSGVN